VSESNTWVMTGTTDHRVVFSRGADTLTLTRCGLWVSSNSPKYDAPNKIYRSGQQCAHCRRVTYYGALTAEWS